MNAPWQTPARESAARRAYVELTARSTFSFLRGASPPEDLVRHARDLEYDAVAVTDCDGLYGIVRAHEAALKQGIRLIVGCELTVGAEPPFRSLVVLVENHEGYTNLCNILTESHRLHPKGKARTREEDLPRNVYAGIPASFVCAHTRGLWALVPPIPAPRTSDLAPWVEPFGERITLTVHRHLDGADAARERCAVEAPRRFGIPVC